MKDDLTLLAEHAYRLYAARERIMSDADMWQTPVCVNPATSGRLSKPSVGAYLKFWESQCGRAIRKDGAVGFLTALSGNCMTGNNSCGVVWEDGERGYTCVDRFIDSFSSLYKLAGQYPACDECGTLEDLINRLA